MMKRTNLAEAEADTTLKVCRNCTTPEIRRKLNSYGLFPGDAIKKINDTRWGPVLIKKEDDDSSKIAIGRGLSEKIMVEHE